MARITAGEIIDNPLVNKAQDAMSEVLRKQKVTETRKNTLFALAQGVLQFGNIGLLVAGQVPWYISVAIAVVLVVAETMAHAFTPGPLTPSAVKKVENELLRKEVTNVNGGEEQFSVYHDL